MLKIADRNLGFILITPRMRVSGRVVEQIVDVLVRQHRSVEVVQPIQEERTQQRAVEEMVDVPLPHFWVSERIVDQTFEEIVEKNQSVLQEQIQERISEEIVDTQASRNREQVGTMARRKTLEMDPVIGLVAK